MRLIYSVVWLCCSPNFLWNKFFTFSSLLQLHLCANTKNEETGRQRMTQTDENSQRVKRVHIGEMWVGLPRVMRLKWCCCWQWPCHPADDTECTIAPCRACQHSSAQSQPAAHTHTHTHTVLLLAIFYERQLKQLLTENFQHHLITT